MRWLTIVIVTSVSCSSALAEQPEIKIGYTLALTGKGAFLGIQSRAGAQLAAKEFNESGVSVKVIIEDHQSEPKVAVAATTKFLDIDKVSAILCDLTPTCTATSPIVAKGHRLFFYQSPAASIALNNTSAFRAFLDYEEGCRAIAKEWKRSGIKKIGHLKWNSEAGELCLKGAGDVYPDQIVRNYNSGDDLRSDIVALKGEKIEALIQTGYEGDYISSLKSATNLDFAVPFGMPEPVLTKAVLESAGQLPEGSIVFGFKPLNGDFVKRLKSAYLYVSDVMLEGAAIGYLQVQAAVAGLKGCATDDLECSVHAVEQMEPTDSALQFLGWKDRKARLELILKVMRQGQLTIVN